jgi:predicted metalloprotease
MRRLLNAAGVIASVAALVTGCTKVIDGKPVSASANPYEVSGIPATDEPSGLRPNAPGPTREAENGDDSAGNRLALMAIADVEGYWTAAYGPPLKGTFKPVNALFSYDSRFKYGRFCSRATYGDTNAYWCPGGEKCTSTITPSCSDFENNIAWDRGVLLPLLQSEYVDMGAAFVLAHEYGHAIQYTMADLIHESDLVVLRTVAEQQADCFAGVYLKWVADGKSPRFTLSLGDGLNKVLLALVIARDPLLGAADPGLQENVHGSAFERISAFQFGFQEGASACAGINGKEIQERRGHLPPEFLKNDQTGEALPSEGSVKAVIDTLVTIFKPTDAPKITYERPSCPDAKPTPPASYCPSTNTISIDLNRLILMGTSLTRGSCLVSTFTAPLFGDYTAYSLLVSRFMMALEKEKGLKLDTADAGLRTACLTGVATTKLTTTANELTGGDLDEAVSGLLKNGLIASNVNGEFAPVAFSRVDAFRTGVLGTEENCYNRWP